MRDGDSQQVDQENSIISRRKMLALTSGSLVGIAGCSSESDPADTATDGDTPAATDTPSGDDTPADTPTGTPSDNETSTSTPAPLVDDSLTTTNGRLPTQMDISDGSQNYPFTFGPFLYTPDKVPVSGGQFQTPEHMSLLKDWRVVDGAIGGENPPVIEEEYRSGFHWWDGSKSEGKEITADDLIFASKFNYWTEEYANIVEDQIPTTLPEKVDEYTIRYEWNDPVNAIDVRDSIGVSPQIPAGADPWKGWIEDAKAAIENEDEEAHTNIQSEIADHLISPTDIGDWGIAHGPYRLTDAGVNEMTFELRDPEMHPAVEHIDVPKVNFTTAKAGTDRAKQLVIQGEVDFREGMLTEPLKSSSPDYYQTLDSYETGVGNKIIFNWTNKHVGRLNVRRAIAAITDQKQILGNGWKTSSPLKYQVGMGGQNAIKYLGQDFLDKTYKYGTGAKPEAAKQFMKDAGYSKNSDGVWADSDGNEVSLTIRGPTWQAWVLAMKTFTQQLKDFGFKVELITQSSNTFYSEIDSENFDLAPFMMASGYNNYAPTWNWPGALALGEGVEPGDEMGDQWGKPNIVSRPMTVGDLDGETTQMDITALWDNELPFAQSIEEVGQIFQQYAAWWNYAVPDLLIGVGVTGTQGDTRDFNWPEEGHEGHRSTNYPAHYMVKSGLVEGVREDQ
jgi:hypothetical protein